MGRRTKDTPEIKRHSDFVKLGTGIKEFDETKLTKVIYDYLDRINVINFGNKKLIFNIKEFGKKPAPAETQPPSQPQNVDPKTQPPEKSPEISSNFSSVDKIQEKQTDGFIDEYEKIRYKTNFYDLRLKLEDMLSRKGEGAVSINIDKNENIYHQVCEINDILCNQIGEPIELTIITDKFKDQGRYFTLYEKYTLKDHKIVRYLMSNGVKEENLNYCPYPVKKDDSFADIDFIPVQVFYNNWNGSKDYEGMEFLVQNLVELIGLSNKYVKITMPKMIYKSFLNSSQDKEEIENMFVGTLEEMRTFIVLEDSDTEFQTPFTPFSPNSNIDKHWNSIKEAFALIHRFSMTNKDVSEKGTVQQSTGEISQMNAVPELYQEIKEHLRLKGYSWLADKTNKYMITYTDFSGDEEAIYEASFEDMKEKPKPTVPLNPFQPGNQIGLVDPNNPKDGEPGGGK